MDATVLVLHDTTEFTYHRRNIRAVGILHRLPLGKGLNGQLRHYVVCGIQMHASLAVTTNGLPLGLTAMKFWTRNKFTGCNALKKKVSRTRVPIEKKESVRWLENLKQSSALLKDPERCVHIGDRESDIYELFCTAQVAGTHFLIRTARLGGYLARAGDSPPGNTVLWRGVRLTDIELGFVMEAELVSKLKAPPTLMLTLD